MRWCPCEQLLSHGRSADGAQSTLKFMQLVGGNPVPFAMAYSAGNIVSLAGYVNYVVDSSTSLRIWHSLRELGTLLLLLD